MTPLLLAMLLLLGLAAVLLDLGVFGRGSRMLPLPGALAWSTFWLAVALVFTGLVYLVHEGGLQVDGVLSRAHLTGQEAALQFFNGFVIGKSIALANVLVIAMIFAHFGVPLASQHRALVAALLAIVVLRAALLWPAWWLVSRLAWANDLFGVLLIASAARVFVARPEKIEPRRNLAVILLEWRFPPAPASTGAAGPEAPTSGDRFLEPGAEHRASTPLLAALVLALTSCVMFAVDAVAGGFAATRDPVLAVAAHLFSLLGLRAMYFVFVGFIDRLRYLTLSLAVLLGFVGVQLILAGRYAIPEFRGLTTLGAILAAGLLLSMLLGPREAPGISPMLRGLEELVWISYRQGRRLVVFLIGVTVMLVGVIMLVTPGPAFVMIPLGLAILAIEFAWARRWMARLRRGARQVEGRVRQRLQAVRPPDREGTRPASGNGAGNGEEERDS